MDSRDVTLLCHPVQMQPEVPDVAAFFTGTQLSEDLPGMDAHGRWGTGSVLSHGAR